jgi:hypothetical protein
MAKRKRRRKTRYHLILYDRFFRRYRVISFLLFLSLLASWFANSTQFLVLPFDNISGLFLSGAILFFGFWLFTTLGPLFAFVQTFDDYLLLQTPFYRLKVPYHHILNTRPVEIRKLYPASRLSAGQRNLLGPYLGQTALAVDLQGFPPPSFSLRLFFHRLTFSPEAAGIILLVHDWMGLSNRLSVSLDTWRMAHTDHPTHGASDAANILRDS